MTAPVHINNWQKEVGASVIPRLLCYQKKIDTCNLLNQLNIMNMRKKRMMLPLLPVFMAVCIVGCSSDEDSEKPIDKGEISTELQVHPKGSYVARIVAFDKQSNPISVVESAPATASLSPWPVVNDTVVLLNAMEGVAYNEGGQVSFQIQECQWQHPKYLQTLGRRWKWNASVEPCVEGSEDTDDGSERYADSVLGYVDYLVKFPQGGYEAVVIANDANGKLVKVTSSPVAAQDSLWPVVNDTLSLEGSSLVEDGIDKKITFEIENCNVDKRNVLRRNTTFWFSKIVYKQ